ncbi:MAG: hypothetical protein V7K36_20555 [Nostoc sp.]
MLKNIQLNNQSILDLLAENTKAYYKDKQPANNCELLPLWE